MSQTVDHLRTQMAENGCVSGINCSTFEAEFNATADTVNYCVSNENCSRGNTKFLCGSLGTFKGMMEGNSCTVPSTNATDNATDACFGGGGGKGGPPGGGGGKGGPPGGGGGGPPVLL